MCPKAEEAKQTVDVLYVLHRNWPFCIQVAKAFETVVAEHDVFQVGKAEEWIQLNFQLVFKICSQ